MPLSADVATALGPTADRFEITAFSVNLEAGLVRADYRAGVMQPAGSDPPVQWVADRLTFSFPVADVVNATPDGTLTYYENIKALLYAKAQELGVFPAGAVE